jgi:peptide-methionine (S)-S-oxide reductase
MQKVAFGGGCFWCTEAVFKLLKGVSKVVPGYAGGSREDATYMAVSSGKTQHAEVAYLEYDPAEAKFRDLLTVFFASHDSTTVNRQGNDVGPQYRSAIFYSTEEQKKESEEFIKKLNASNEKGAPVATELAPLTEFFEAEDYHKDYFANHGTQAYCQVIINPKLEKVQKEYGELLKKIG